jgi:spermidine synthase
MGQVEPTSIDLDVIEARLALPEYAPVVASLAQIGMYSSADLFVTHIGDATSLAPWLADAQVNRDRNLRLQYLAGMNHNRSQTGLIHEQMAATWRYPEGLFKGSPERVAALRSRMGSW